MLPIGDIIRDAFALAWRHKYLWLFGLFLSGAGPTGLQFGKSEPDIEAAKAWILAALALILFFGLLFALVVLVLHVICKSALIYNVYQIETNGAHGISAGWDFGVKRFWAMLGLTLLQFFCLAVLVFALMMIEIVIFAIALPLGFLSLLFAVPVFFAAVALIVLVWNYADRFVVLESRGVFDAVSDGWNLLRRQWQPSVQMLLAKFLIGVMMVVASAVVGLAVGLPAVAIWMVSKPLAIVYGVLVLVPLFVVVSAYFGTFDSATWTKVFLRLRAPVYAASGSTTVPAPPPTPPDRPSGPALFE